MAESIHNEKRILCEILKTRRLQVDNALKNSEKGNELLLAYLIGCASRIMLEICEKYKTKAEIKVETNAPRPNQENQAAKTIIKCADCFES